MSRREATPGSNILTFKVTLEESDPPIWRRFQTTNGITLGDLHYVVQLVMGWFNCHLHEFQVGRKRYGMILPDDHDLGTIFDEDEVDVLEAIDEGKRFHYLYDFGDSWMHKLVLEKISDPQPGVRYPVCVDGDGTCPPEDCGGIGGYYNMLEILKNPAHTEYDSIREWLSSDFKPKPFEIALVNNDLENVDALRRYAEGDDDDELLELFDNFVRAQPYDEPVSRLLEVGEPKTAIKYADLAIAHEHIPELIRMATDMSLHHTESETAEVWAPLHAWRALGQLRAEAAIEPLISLFRLVDEDDDDWVAEDLPHFFEEIGAAAIPALSAYLRDDSHGLWARASAGESLCKVAQRYPDTRDACVRALCVVLEAFQNNDTHLNALLIWDLMDLKALESVPVMERAFAADAVDLSVVGDWEEVQIKLGLLNKRITPPQRWGLWPHMGVPQKNKTPQQSTGKSAAKNKKKRKDQKKSRKKNRRN